MNNYNYAQRHQFTPSEEQGATFQKNLVIATFNRAVSEKLPRQQLNQMHNQALKILAECNKKLGLRPDDGFFHLKSWS